MARFFTLLLGGLLAALGSIPSAHAQLTIDNVTRTIMPNERPIQNFNVHNISDHRILKGTVEIKEFFRNMDDSETTKPTNDFMVAPASLILRPGDRKVVRLVMRRPPSDDVERYYNINFQASIPEPLELKALGLKQGESKKKNTINAQISVVSGIGAFLTVAPKHINAKLTWSRDATGITFKNDGNVSVDMRPRKNYCFDRDKKDCVELPFKRIYPGHTWRFPISGDKAITYYYNVYNSTNPAVIGAVQ